jgi:hypothetical protein
VQYCHEGTVFRIDSDVTLELNLNRKLNTNYVLCKYKEIEVRKILINRLRRIRDYRLETGFSMLEAVVVVGVLLALAVGGFVAYGTISENAKRAAVKSAASQLHTGVVAANFDGVASTTPSNVISEWNASNDKTVGEIISPKEGETSANGDFCVEATYKSDPNIKSRSGACDDVPGGGVVTDPTKDTDGDGLPDTSDPDIDGDGIPNAEDPTPNGDSTGGNTGGNTGGVITASAWSANRTIINRYPDPGFKNGITGWTGNRIQSAYTDDATVTVDYAMTGYNGDAGALKISATGSAGHDRATAYFPINTANVRGFSFKITTPDGTWDPNASWYAGVMVTDKTTGEVIGSGSYETATRAGGLGANLWESYDYFNNFSAATQPHNTYLYIQADHIPAGRTVTMLVDRMFVTDDADCGWDCAPPESPSVANYEKNFDGSYSSSADWNYSWLGATNNSPSKAVSPKAIAAPTNANVGDTIQVKGSGYPANSAVTPTIFFGWTPGYDSRDIIDPSIQTDGSGNFDTTIKIPADTQPWNWKVTVVEDTSYRATTDIEINAPAGPAPTPPGPWSTLVNGSPEQISAPTTVTIGQDFTVIGRGYGSFKRVEVYSDDWNLDVYAYTDKNGNFSVNIPSAGVTPGPGGINTWENEEIHLDVNFQ